MRTEPPDALATPSTGPAAAEVAASAALAFECAQRDGSPFSIACFAIDGLDADDEPRGPRADAVRTLARLALDGDSSGRVFVWHQGAHLVVAFEGATLAQAEHRARHVLESARSSSQPQLAAHAVAGLASTQAGSAFWFDVLLAVAEEGVAVASASGFGGVAHTELYGLVEKKLARTRGPYRPSPDLPPPGPKPAAAPATLAPARETPVTPREVAPPAAQAPAVPVAPPAPIAPSPADEEARSSQIEMYERRIAKLLRALEEAQRELSARSTATAGAAIAASEPVAETRTRSDAEIEEKRALFARLLEQNLALRDALRRAS